MVIKMRKSVGLKLLSLFLALVLVCQILPLNVWAEEAAERAATAENTGVDVEPGQDHAEILDEVPERRGESEKHFLRSDGSYLAVQYEVPVHYEDADGQWEEIDNTLTLQSDAAQTAAQSLLETSNHEQASGFYTAEIGTSRKGYASMLYMGQPLLFASEGDFGVGMSLLPQNSEPEATEPEGTEPEVTEPVTEAPLEETQTQEPVPAEPETLIQHAAQGEEAPELEPAEQLIRDTRTAGIPAVVTNPGDPESAFAVQSANGSEKTWEDRLRVPTLYSSVRYADVLPGVDLLYENYSYTMKESILVKQALDRYSFSFRLELAGLTPVLQEDGSVLLNREDGEAVYAIPAPYMADAEGDTSNAVAYTLTEEDGGWAFTITADKAWIEAEGRAFPVAIDPTLETKASTGKDSLTATYVKEEHPNESHPGYQQLYMGDAYNAGKSPVYLGWDNLPTIPVDSVVVGAYFGMYQYAYSAPSGTSMDIVAKEVTQEKPADYSSYRSWIRNLTWNTRPTGSDEVIDYAATSSDTNSSKTRAYVKWDVTRVVTKWYEEHRTTGAMELSYYNPNQYKRATVFLGYDPDVPAYLMVAYRNNVGIEPYYTYQTMGAGNAGTAYISDYSGQLTVAKSLVSYASGINPFHLQLVFNSAYFANRSTGVEKMYDLCQEIGLGMHTGSGVTYSMIQQVKEEVLGEEYADKDTPVENREYIRYLDGDGTIHYFAKQEKTSGDYKAGLYYDEDGLGLKIEKKDGKHIMSDDKDNKKVFVNGFLRYTEDANGNKIRYYYVTDSNSTPGDPAASGSRITKITQQNNGGEEIEVARLTYASHTLSAGRTEANYLNTIKDYAGTTYQLHYTSGKLTSRYRNGTPLVSYTMRMNGTLALNQLNAMTDLEDGYTLSFTYENGRVSSVEESKGEETGARIEIQTTQDRGTVYRDTGADRISGTQDDILTYYAFDYAGRTVNAYTTDWKDNILGASNAVHSGSGSTDKTNNRTLRTATIGAAAQQWMSDFSFETHTDWTLTGVKSETGNTTNIVFAQRTTDASVEEELREKIRTGTWSLKGWISNGTRKTIGAARQTVSLTAGRSYTLSAYVNTVRTLAATGNGIYLQVKDAGGVTTQSQYLNEKSSAEVDEGWVRLSVTFTPTVSGAATVGVYNDGLNGLFYADDFQLEEGEAVSNLNLVENGSFS